MNVPWSEQSWDNHKAAALLKCLSTFLKLFATHDRSDPTENTQAALFNTIAVTDLLNKADKWMLPGSTTKHSELEQETWWPKSLFLTVPFWYNIFS